MVQGEFHIYEVLEIAIKICSDEVHLSTGKRLDGLNCFKQSDWHIFSYRCESLLVVYSVFLVITACNKAGPIALDSPYSTLLALGTHLGSVARDRASRHCRGMNSKAPLDSKGSHSLHAASVHSFLWLLAMASFQDSGSTILSRLMELVVGLVIRALCNPLRVPSSSSDSLTRLGWS